MRRRGEGRGGLRGRSVPRMALPTGTHRLGPGNAALEVRTYREGVAAKAGHDLIIDVTRWDATVEVAGEPAGWTIELNADPRSLEVREGLRGVKPLTDKDRVEIRKNIDEKILGSDPIRFRSSGVRVSDDGGRVTVEGQLSMAGNTRPLTAHLSVAEGGEISGTILLTQSAWGIKPYRGLMGALKVRDEHRCRPCPSLPLCAKRSRRFGVGPAAVMPPGRTTAVRPSLRAAVRAVGVGASGAADRW